MLTCNDKQFMIKEIMVERLRGVSTEDEMLF
jgi:hypothetical protein